MWYVDYISQNLKKSINLMYYFFNCADQIKADWESVIYYLWGIEALGIALKMYL